MHVQSAASCANIFQRSEDVATIVRPDEHSLRARSQVSRSTKVAPEANDLVIHTPMKKQTRMLFQQGDQLGNRVSQHQLSQVRRRSRRAVDRSSQGLEVLMANRCLVDRLMP